ncbi:MAG: 4Fe-4S binding protein [Oscillospiraceae bacterium]|nr:4Fe-4S binding protein [Oscillospiraceae bacterium]
MKKIYVNEQWCLGCRLCEYYCAFAGTGERDMARALAGMKIHPRMRIEEKDGISFAVSCRHCKDALCVKSCITGALTVTDGMVAIDQDRCVGCCTCVLVCPFGAVASTAHGVMQKCELCVQSSAGTPACVRGCPNGAIVFEERGAAR